MHAIPEDELPDDPARGEDQPEEAPLECAPLALRLPDEELLSAYLDGQLHGPELARAERLLEERPQLRQLLEELQNLSAALRCLPRVELKADFYQQVLHQAEREMLVGRGNSFDQETPTLSATTLPAMTLPLPQREGPAQDGKGAGGAVAGSQSQPVPSEPPSHTQSAAALHEADATCERPTAASLPAGVPAALEQSPASTLDTAHASCRPEICDPPAARLWWPAAAVVGGLAALLVLGVFLNPKRGALRVAHTPDEAPRGASELMQAPGLGHPAGEHRLRQAPTAPGGAPQSAAGATAVHPQAAAEGKAGEPALGGGSGQETGATGSQPQEGRNPRRQSHDGEPGATAAAAVLQGAAREGQAGQPREEQVEQGDREQAGFARAKADTLVVHCEVAPDDASLLAFQQILEQAHIAWFGSNAMQLKAMLRKFADQLPAPAADALAAAVDEEPSDEKLPDAPRASQGKYASASMPPAFEVWYVVATPQQVDVVLAAMAQQPDVFRNTSVLPGGLDAVPLDEWQAPLPMDARADALTAEDVPGDNRAVRNRELRRRHGPQAGQANGLERALHQDNAAAAPPNADREAPEDDEASASEPPVPTAAEPTASGEVGAKQRSVESTAEGGTEKRAEDESGGFRGGGAGAMEGGPELFEGEGAMGFALRWHLETPSFAHTLQHLLARVVPLLRGVSEKQQADAPQAPGAPLPDAPQDANKPANADVLVSGDASESSDASPEVEPDMPAAGPDAPARKDSRQGAASPDAEADADGTEGQRAYDNAASRKQTRAPTRGQRTGNVRDKDASAGLPGRNGQAAAAQEGTASADRAADAGMDDNSAPAGHDRQPGAYRRVLFVLRFVPAESAP